MAKPSITPPPASPRTAAGLSLVELLITTVLGALILAVAARVLTSDIRSTSSQEAIQQMRDHWGRVNYFVDTEVREGLSLSKAPGADRCVAASNPLLTITVPAPGGTSTIHYYEQGGSLWRCGPDINADGTLDFNTTINGILVENATMQTTITNNKNVSYTLTLRRPGGLNGLVYSATSEARTSGRPCDTTSGICY